ncbi:hypothetical protein [Polyangium aurulentum]|uniref:hypothetical protein n=1 Tax=Polyangium aurulentum TaxID=2567896 RepID=UPI0010AEC960|nr:hypothetical protein [Polyangium aurulentum]UQA62223.1 hypothetical protein E8A73_017835 [Polyangium aurulentum]
MPRNFLRPLLATALFLPALHAPRALAQPATPPPGAEAKAPSWPDADSMERAEELRAKGAQLCAEGKADEGIRALEQALRLDDETPAIAADLGACELSQGRHTAAAEHLAKAIRGLPAGEDSEQLRTWRALFDKARAKVAVLRIEVDVPGADILAGKRILGQSPLPADVYVEPGEILVMAKSERHGEAERTVRVTAGGGATIKLSPKKPDTMEKFTPKPGPSPWPAVGLGVAGAGLGIAGIVMLVGGYKKGSEADTLLAQIKKQTQLDAPCVTPSEPCTTLKDLRGQRDDKVNLGVGLGIAGGALLAGGIVYTVLAFGSSESSRRRYAIAPAVGPGSAGLSVAGSF